MSEPLRRETRPRTHRRAPRPTSMPVGQLVAVLLSVAFLAWVLIQIVTAP